MTDQLIGEKKGKEHAYSELPYIHDIHTIKYLLINIFYG